MFRAAKKLSTRRLSSKYYYVEFELAESLTKDPLPFQFVNIWIPRVDEIPMSIAQYRETQSTLSVIFKVVGDGTRALNEYNGFFGVKGPLGNGLDPCSYDKLLFLAGGVGIAPLPYLSEYASRCGVAVDVVWGVRSGDMLFNLKELAKYLGEVYYATEDCSVGFCGTATQLATKLLSSGNRWDVVVAAGPIAMLRDLCGLLGSRTSMYVSVEAMVKCGLGACGSCILKPYPKLLCVDGPVFKCDEVKGYLERFS